MPIVQQLSATHPTDWLLESPQKRSTLQQLRVCGLHGTPWAPVQTRLSTSEVSRTNAKNSSVTSKWKTWRGAAAGLEVWYVEKRCGLTALFPKVCRQCQLETWTCCSSTSGSDSRGRQEESCSKSGPQRILLFVITTERSPGLTYH